MTQVCPPGPLLFSIILRGYKQVILGKKIERNAYERGRDEGSDRERGERGTVGRGNGYCLMGTFE